jgi:hypothetical protein
MVETDKSDALGPIRSSRECPERRQRRDVNQEPSVVENVLSWRCPQGMGPAQCVKPADRRRRLIATMGRDAALVVGVGLDRLRVSQLHRVASAAARAPRPVVIAAGVAAAAGMVAFLHFTGFTEGVGAATGLPLTPAASPTRR